MNDGPVLETAGIGFFMGATGTKVAKQVGGIPIDDRMFATLPIML